MYSDAGPGCQLMSVIAPEFATGNPVDLLALGALHDTHLFQPRCGRVPLLTNLG